MRGCMSSKVLNIALVIFFLFSIVIASSAKAGLIENTVYTDANGLEWIYLGSFVTNDGPDYQNASSWNTANGFDPTSSAHAVNGLEAAGIIFGFDIADLALSAFDFDEDLTDGFVYVDPDPTSSETALVAGAAIVNHLAWYARVGGTVNGVVHSGSVQRYAEGIEADGNADDLYSTVGDKSAYVDDRTDIRTNYVFKVVDIPEPSTLAIFSLALFGLSLRQFKKS
jgi:hypothetical protein